MTRRHAATEAPRTALPVLLGAIAAVLVVGAVVVALGQRAGTPTGHDAATTRSEAAAVVTTAPPSPSSTPTPDAELTIVATGDVLPHTPVISSARTSDGYDFAPLLAGLDPWVSAADLALCHLEVPVAPPGVRPSGYPIFGAPKAIARDLAAQGWDGCSTASNHSVDRGWAGVEATLDALDSAGLGHVGTARSQREADQPQVYELERAGRTVRIAHLAATYGTNGMPVDDDKPWSVDLIDTDRIIDQAKAARDDGADLVVASIHCCVEYQTEPTAEQEQTAATLAASGEIDLLIGHHAHVPQPLARLEGGPGGDGMWVAYGLGNYLSNQSGECCTPKSDSGIMLTATALVPAEGPVRVTGAEWTAVTVSRPAKHKVFALSEITDGGGKLSAKEVRARYERVRKAAGTGAPERTAPVSPTGPPPTVVPRAGGGSTPD